MKAALLERVAHALDDEVDDFLRAGCDEVSGDPMAADVVPCRFYTPMPLVIK